MPVFQEVTRGAVGIVLPVEDDLVAGKRNGGIVANDRASPRLVCFEFPEDGGMDALNGADNGAGTLAVAGWALGGPSLGLPLGAVAVAVGWSRCYLGRHSARQVVRAFGPASHRPSGCSHWPVLRGHLSHSSLMTIVLGIAIFILT